MKSNLDELEAVEREHGLADEGVRLTPLRDIRSEPIQWLWHGWLAREKLHILAGAPGTGKTTLALSLAATISAGGRWPDGSRAEASNVLIWSGEDGAGDTLAPRLRAAGADEDRVHVVRDVWDSDGRRPFDPAEDLPGLAAKAGAIGDVAMILIDPVITSIGAADSHKNAETRRALGPLVDLGQTLGAAILGISHFTKGTAGRDPVERVCGSLAFGALARIVMATAKRDEAAEDGTERLLARAKSNIGPDGGGFGYDLQLIERDAIETSVVAWGAALEGNARELLAAAEPHPEGAGRPDNERQEAMEWLREVLSGGPVLQRDVKTDSRDAGISWATVRRAKEDLKVISYRDGEGRKRPWFWRLPLDAQLDAQNPKGNNSEHLFPIGQQTEGKGGLKCQKRDKGIGVQNSTPQGDCEHVEGLSDWYDDPDERAAIQAEARGDYD